MRILDLWLCGSYDLLALFLERHDMKYQKTHKVSLDLCSHFCNAGSAGTFSAIADPLAEDKATG